MSRLSIPELQQIFRTHLIDLLGYADRKEKDLVRLAYQGDGQENGQAFHDPNRDICYFYLQPVDDPINRQVDTKYTPVDETQAKQINSYIRVIELNLSFYGSNGYDQAVLLRLDLLEPLQNAYLAEHDLRVIPDIAEPFPTWEMYNNKWLPRTDLQVRFNNRVTDERAHTVGYIQAVPVMVVGGAEERTIEVKEKTVELRKVKPIEFTIK